MKPEGLRELAPTLLVICPSGFPQEGVRLYLLTPGTLQVEKSRM